MSDHGTLPGMPLLAAGHQLDLALCRFCNRANRRWLASRFFGVVSRLGDGWFWYALMLALPLLFGSVALLASLHMAVTGAVALVIYRRLKERTSRPRPFLASPAIHRTMPPLDQYSFPSGHTLHAVAFAVVLLAWYPAMAWLVVPFVLLVAASRVVLGLHYPSDVLAGAAIGGVLARVSLWLVF